MFNLQNKVMIKIPITETIGYDGKQYKWYRHFWISLQRNPHKRYIGYRHEWYDRPIYFFGLWLIEFGMTDFPDK